MNRTPNRSIAAPARERRRSFRPHRRTHRSPASRRTGLALLGVIVAVLLTACLQPPTSNIFPIPRSHSYSFSDTWHACRDGCARKHQGSDIFAPKGTPLVAVEAGTIAAVDNTDNGNGGLTVWLRGNSGVTYYYAHNDANLVYAGERVTRGETIARVGRTGNARTTPAHVHFQVNRCGRLNSSEPCTVNPYPYVKAWPLG